MNRKLYAALLAVSLLAGIAGLLTLLPRAGASYPNVFGYRSLCTFAPAASLFCFSIAGITCIIRASMVKRAAYNSGKPVFRAGAFVAVILVLSLAVASTIWVGGIRSDYVDGTTAATEEAQ